MKDGREIKNRRKIEDEREIKNERKMLERDGRWVKNKGKRRE